MKVILHIPHSSRIIPEEYRNSFLLTDRELEKELDAMTDSYTDTLFPSTYERIVYPVSRLLSDPERFREDSEETMAAVGMGALYTHGSERQEIRRDIKRDEILERYYDSHHRALEESVGRALGRDGEVLVLDCHSFSAVPLPYEKEKDPDRPDICIGTDSFHTPPSLSSLAFSFFKCCNLDTRLDTPYSGAIVPASRFRRDRRVYALMIEINRGLYMDKDGRKKDGFRSLQEILSRFVAEAGSGSWM